VKLDIEIGGAKRRIELIRADGVVRWLIDGQPLDADAVEVSPGVYSILINGRSFEARVESASADLRVVANAKEYKVKIQDPRAWKRNRAGAAEAEGRQQVLAPMPGKIVRVLVQAGDQVEAGQGLLVVEAMKMQNEIRAPKTGKIERVAVVAGQTVNAGETVAVVI
jgi:biotin carboxyl carrier protein